ncbi:MAG: anthranilate phosphoribosyltransferase [Rickettsiales bacterium]|nr:anthranilate phosphoribosyltransferase [Rickettsiales bacterium]
MKDYLLKIQTKKTLSNSDLKSLFIDITKNNISDSEKAAILFYLSTLDNIDSQILLLCKILRDKAKKINLGDDIIDVCGTGGDNKNTLNISTAVAIITSCCDIKIAKHGNKAISSLSGSADVLKELGINISQNNETIQKQFAKHNIAFLFAPNFHPIIGNFAKVRKELGVKTIFNLIGPLLNPANTSRQLIGIYDKNLIKTYGEAVKKLDYKNINIVSSKDGMDEISISSETLLYNPIKEVELIINPKTYGFKLHDIKDIKGGDSKYNARKMLDLFSGVKNAYYDIVILNAAFALLTSEKYSKIEDALEIIEEKIKSGFVLDKLNNIKEINE